MKQRLAHQFIDRVSGRICTEQLIADRMVHLIYSTAREKMPRLFELLTSARSSALISQVSYDLQPVGTAGVRKMAAQLGIDLHECVDVRQSLKSPRHLFERQICYWHCRPMPDAPRMVVSPADARVLVGSFSDQNLLYLKEKFFDREELIGAGRQPWHQRWQQGDFAIFRLTPEKYHYNHCPVSGRVLDIYSIDGVYHSCNPAAVIHQVTPFSKNKRVVTIIDTDVAAGTGVGVVAMIEVVALMIGDIRQCYSDHRYADPRSLQVGDDVVKGQPKSLYRPGSSVDVLAFEPGRVRFCEDIVTNMHHPTASSRYGAGFCQPLVETDVRLRSPVATAACDAVSPSR